MGAAKHPGGVSPHYRRGLGEILITNMSVCGDKVARYRKSVGVLTATTKQVS